MNKNQISRLMAAWGKKGSTVRNEVLSSERRREIAVLANKRSQEVRKAKAAARKEQERAGKPTGSAG